MRRNRDFAATRVAQPRMPPRCVWMIDARLSLRVAHRWHARASVPCTLARLDGLGAGRLNLIGIEA